MEKIIHIISQYDQLPLYATLTYDENSTKGLVQILHGMAEHRERYQYFVQQLVKAGYAVLNCDERGHGQSAVTKGYFSKQDGWIRNVEDLYQLTLLAKKEIDLPLILFGHSMGSLVARSYLKRHEDIVTKVVLSGTPSNNPAAKAGGILCKLIIAFKGEMHRSALMNNMSFGSFNKGITNPETDFDWLSVNKENVQNYIDDPDCGFVFTAKGFADLMFGINDVYQKDGWNVNKSALPIQFFSGEDDPCMATEKGMKEAVDILKSFGYKDVNYHLFKGLRHEILLEKERDLVIEKMIQFMEKGN